MASRSDRLAAAGAFVAATALSAALWWIGSGVAPLWWATWLAPLPVLAYALRTSRSAAFAAALVAWSTGGLNVWTYLDLVHVPVPVKLLATLGPALVFAVATLLARAFAQRGRIGLAALSVPLVAVSADYANYLTSVHGTFFNLAYTQMDALTIIQLAAVCGAWGIGFMVMLLPSALAALSAPQGTRGARVRLAALTIAAFAGVIAYGTWRLQTAAAGNIATARVGLLSLQGETRVDPDSAAGKALLQRYVEAIGQLADAGATIAVIPEAAFVSSTPRIAELDDVARERHMIVLTGAAYTGDAAGERNASLIFGSGAPSPLTYFKHHLLPPFESRATPGDGYTTFDRGARIGTAVCKDMDFPPIGFAYAERDTNLLLVPAWDFNVDGWLHSRMAILRGVESGFALARAARNGALTLSDDRGRVIGETSSIHIADTASLVGDLPLRATKTLYARWGDWFAWTCAAALVLCVGVLVFARKR
jgi:apolipoprotein N-acyltransferase